MSKEELIRYGNDYYRDLVNACCGVEEKHKEFVRESIKALEQEPCEVEATKLQQAYNKGFEDCKQAVLDMATTIQTDDFSGNEVIEVVDIDDIKALPPITQKSSEDMPCITPEEMQECKDIVKKYTPKQEPCNDVISREATLKPYKGLNDEDTISVWLIRKNIEQQLPVTPRSKTGHWINGDCICPCCGEDKFKDLDADIWSDWQPKYCPNCGAKMQEGEV